MIMDPVNTPVVKKRKKKKLNTKKIIIILLSLAVLFSVLAVIIHLQQELQTSHMPIAPWVM